MSAQLPASLELRIITPNKLLVEAQVASVRLPGLEGELGIHPGHRPLLAALGTGRLSFIEAKGERSVSVKGGYAEILPDRVYVFTECGQDETDRPAEGSG